MSGTGEAHQAVELAVVERNGFIESRHVGSAVVVDPSGEIVVALGVPEAPVLARSCLKPFQAIAVMETGVDLTDVHVALATASHRAEQRHVEVVEQILAAAGVSATDLQCPSVLPADPTYRHFIRDTRPTSPLYFNCSGKHAAFLAAQVHANEPTGEYLAPESFIQRRVVATITQYCGQAPDHTGIDGCGAPVHALPLTALARGISKVTAGSTPAAATLVRAVLDHPWAIEGTRQPNTVTIERLGVFAKFGAEGVLVMGTLDGYAVAVKTLDGAQRANSLVALELLAHVGAIDAAQALSVIHDVTPAITGGTNTDGSPRTVGTIGTGAGLLAVLRGGLA